MIPETTPSGSGYGYVFDMYTAAAKGLDDDGTEFTVTVLDADNFLLDGEDSAEYKAYEGGGEIITNPVDVSDMTVPKNEAIVEVVAHNLTSGMRALVEGVSSPTIYNGNEYPIEVVDANRIRLVGASTSGAAAYTSGGTVRISESGLQWVDNVTEGSLEVSGYSYTADQYASAPFAKYSIFVKDRLWLFGVGGNSQKAYYSESIGGDTGTPANDAIAFPRKFATWFKGDYCVTCAGEANVEETGILNIGDDLYFFLNERIYALFGGDPTLSSPILVSPDIGCSFPYTLCEANIPYLNGRCLLFLSNRGPAAVLNGGEVRLLDEFAAEELWPDTGEIYSDLRGSSTEKRHILNNCTAMYWQDTFSVAYKTYAGSHKVLECYFSQELSKNNQAPKGSSEMELSEI